MSWYFTYERLLIGNKKICDEDVDEMHCDCSWLKCWRKLLKIERLPSGKKKWSITGCERYDWCCCFYCFFFRFLFSNVSPCVIERDTMSLHPTFVEYMDGARLYLEMETDKENASIREVKIHFCDFIRKMIKNFSCKFRHTEWLISDFIGVEYVNDSSNKTKTTTFVRCVLLWHLQID